jgi:mRNA-degrading endonuclease RelE of RelBE toxin-antitoxin system
MKIKFTNRACKDLRKLPARIKAQLREVIRSLADDPYQGIKLLGRWEGYRRVRFSKACIPPRELLK